MAANTAKMTTPNVAILGAGNVGLALATRLVKSGYSVSISNSRGPASLQVEEQSTGATAMDLEPALARAGIVILALPQVAIMSLRATLKASLLPDTVVIDTGNYYPARDGHIEALDGGTMDSVWVAEMLSPLPVVKVFNSIIAANINTNARKRGSPDRSALPIAGDDDAALTVVEALVDKVGFDTLRAGRLTDSWRQQPAQPAYCTEPTLKELPTLLARADPKQGLVERNKTRVIVERLPADFSPQVLVRVSRFLVGLDRWHPKSWAALVTLLVALARGRGKQDRSV